MGTGTLSQPVEPGLTVGLVAALPAEVICLTHGPVELNVPFRINPHLVVMVCGIGASNAGKAAEYLLFQNVRGLISWGTAGALAEELTSGDLLLPEVVQASTGKTYSADRNWIKELKQVLEPSAIRIHTDMLAETKSILKSRAEKAALRSKTGAIATDMETAAIMKTAHANNIPCIAIRAVVDQAGDSLPDEILKHTDIYGTPDLMHILMEIICKPRLLKPLFRLHQGMQAANNTLRSVGSHTNETLMYAH